MEQYATSIGLDVHARSISACAFDPMTGEVTRASFPYDPSAVAEWALSFDAPRAVYESGVTGFHLCRALRALGLDCVVGAVSRMQKPSADRRRKTDRRDAEFLARLLATRNVVEVDVPDEECEAARDLSRALEDAREDLQRAKQRLLKFLLRHGLVFDERTPTGARKGNWTRAWWSWCRAISFAEPDARATFEHYKDEVRRLEDAKRALARKVAEAAGRPRWKPRVDALRCLKGIDVATVLAPITISPSTPMQHNHSRQYSFTSPTKQRRQFRRPARAPLPVRELDRHVYHHGAVPQGVGPAGTRVLGLREVHGGAALRAHEHLHGRVLRQPLKDPGQPTRGQHRPPLPSRPR